MRSASAPTKSSSRATSDEMQKHAGSFDFILDTVSADHDINAYINLLGRDGNITLVGAPEKPLAVAAFGLIFGRRSLSGSPIGGIAETQEMLDFCGEHNITADVEVIPIQKVNEAYERLLKSDVKYRYEKEKGDHRGGGGRRGGREGGGGRKGGHKNQEITLSTRTSRTVALTDAGQRLLERSGAAVDQALESLKTVSVRPGEVTGRVRLSVPGTAVRSSWLDCAEVHRAVSEGGDRGPGREPVREHHRRRARHLRITSGRLYSVVRKASAIAAVADWTTVSATTRRRSRSTCSSWSLRCRHVGQPRRGSRPVPVDRRRTPRSAALANCRRLVGVGGLQVAWNVSRDSGSTAISCAAMAAPSMFTIGRANLR